MTRSSGLVLCRRSGSGGFQRAFAKSGPPGGTAAFDDLARHDLELAGRHPNLDVRAWLERGRLSQRARDDDPSGAIDGGLDIPIVSPQYNNGHSG
jgi:hypothetical protein